MASVQSDVNMITDNFEEAKKLGLNTKKTKLLVISRKKNPPIPTISIKRAKIEQVFSLRGYHLCQFKLGPSHCRHILQGKATLGYLQVLLQTGQQGQSMPALQLPRSPCAKLQQLCLGIHHTPSHKFQAITQKNG